MSEENWKADPELRKEAEKRRRARLRNGSILLDTSGAGEVLPLVCEPPPQHRISAIPPRPWAYGSFLLFGYPAVIGAADGSGKGALAIVIALSMITGRPLLGEHVWRTGPVAIITYEDDQTELCRRIAAACLQYD